MVESLFCAECRDRLFMTAAGREKPADSGLSQKVRSSEGAFAWTETEVFMDKTMIIKSADRFWGYAYVHPRAEKKVEERLRNNGILCYLPKVPHAYMMHSTKVVTLVPMFPGYIFLCLGREEATGLRYQEKKILKIELLFENERETQLIQKLCALQKCEEFARSKPVLVNPGIRPGDRVRITSGPLKDLVTDVIRRDDGNDSVIVNISVLGQHVECSVSAGELKKMTE